MCMNCCGFTACYLSNLPYMSVARTCVFSYEKTNVSPCSWGPQDHLQDFDPGVPPSK